MWWRRKIKVSCKVGGGRARRGRHEPKGLLVLLNLTQTQTENSNVMHRFARAVPSCTWFSSAREVSLPPIWYFLSFIDYHLRTSSFRYTYLCMSLNVVVAAVTARAHDDNALFLCCFFCFVFFITTRRRLSRRYLCTLVCFFHNQITSATMIEAFYRA